jgi:hypothetical protein
MLSQLPAADLPRFRADTCGKVAALKTPDGLRLDVGVRFTVGAV